MNRISILLVLLIMFLSCGNSSTTVNERTFNYISNSLHLSKNLSKAQKVMAGKLDKLFSDLNKKRLFNGSVIVARSGKIIYQNALGISDKSSKILLSDTSMFQLASVSKVITATAILLLHERQVIDINKPFSFYFPDFPYQDVLVKQLLNHRSGLPNYIYTLNSEFYKPDYKMTNQDMYSSFVAKKTPPYLRPNRRFNYSNTNYALLACLIEKTSGKSYSQFLRDELFKPLGMNHTSTITEIDLNGTNVTKPYDNRWRPVAFDASDYVLGDKSIYSTPYDLFLFSEAMYSNKIISPATQELAYTAYSKEKHLSNYGYGWRLKDFKDPDKMEVYHNGWWHGYRSSFHRRLKDTLTVVILSNQLNQSAYQTNKVYEILDNVVISNEEEEED